MITTPCIYVLYPCYLDFDFGTSIPRVFVWHIPVKLKLVVGHPSNVRLITAYWYNIAHPMYFDISTYCQYNYLTKCIDKDMIYVQQHILCLLLLDDLRSSFVNANTQKCLWCLFRVILRVCCLLHYVWHQYFPQWTGLLYAILFCIVCMVVFGQIWCSLYIIHSSIAHGC